MQNLKILIVSLGCDKNLVDTEKMMSMIRRASAPEAGTGYEFTDDEMEADVIIINTCCFIGDAKVESINTIIELGSLKQNPDAHLKYLIAAGCLAKRYREEILKELPEIDGIIDLAGIQQIGNLLRDLQLQDRVNQDHYLIRDDLNLNTGRVLTTGGYYAYLKLADGCDKRCTYCVIPYVRGRYISVPMEALLTEARELAEGGVKELILVAQEITCYGVDLYGKNMLPDLLRKLCAIEGFDWIRLLYCYPEAITEELIQVMAEEPKIVHYIDMPIQHASDRILRRMGRRTDRAAIEEVIGKLRAAMPDIAIRTTLISGFPGETAEDHDVVMQFVNDMEFTRLGVFPYSREEGTPAAEFEGQVEEEQKEAWRDEIMELQQEIAFDHNDAMIGCELEVLVEGKVSGEPAYVARSYMDAPGIDGLVFINTGELLMSGDLVKVRITGAEGYDLIGELIENESAE